MKNADSSDEDIGRADRRRKGGTPFGAKTKDAPGGASDEESVVYADGTDRDEDVVSDSDNGGEIDDERVRRTDRGGSEEPQGIQVEIHEGEYAARKARREARNRAISEEIGDSQGHSQSGRLRKRRRSSHSDEDDDIETDTDSVDRMVPFSAHAFCQGCEAKQNVIILGPIRKRRLKEADVVLAAMQTRYRVPLSRGERRTNENSV